ncbi:hypothetical protein C8A05DRAFT_38690 [Staphylotrichum tortipilum]|uniref:2-oxoadipate dioxygenase/decarboxylase n=1 Tax=Staphylotrichum tortipilum TaxID=2831512 RepID=A0AAN6MCU4_9PEZI|nr:hypothetical protein C8A05DRAFT_38690 [Staphylotrichum longicolle]
MSAPTKQNGTAPCLPPSWDPDHLRTRFVSALSAMYRAEVPLYGSLVDIVRDVDASVLAARGSSSSSLPVRHQLERHGAIRLGTEAEMRTIARLFSLLGMHPVGYYDLKMVGFPLHGTAFRPTTAKALSANPFRVFTTVLRADLIASPSVRKTATSLLAQRELFSPRLRALLAQTETAPSTLTPADADDLIIESLRIFKWHSRATVPLETYLALKREHPMVADIVCFPSAHINHLTPRTLDIDAAQAAMIARGLPAKECIEGPPGGRKCEILLRQTSFKALEERVVFVDESSSSSGSEGEENGARKAKAKTGTHTARFGEIEQRGAAVTRKGRELYDRLLAGGIGKAAEEGRELAEVLGEMFQKEYPDEWDELRVRGLVYFRYRDVEGGRGKVTALGGEVDMETLLEAGAVECEPITYEDFLPLSAAGIFASNLGDGSDGSTERKLQKTEQGRSRAELEALLGCEIPSEIDLYEKLQTESVKECEEALGISGITLAA